MSDGAKADKVRRRKKSVAAGRPLLAARMGWPAADRPVMLRAAFAFGTYSGPARVVAERDGGAAGHRKSLIVEFDHPVTGQPHQAVVTEEDIIG